ncbi:MAG TPA: saccharopine dehydrogenase C-terminal domain-containing protein [Candidatus Acidoferrales bacterium]|nr:saccharopine dehydrogenase C-terminal domain-containing protein [Candidatus Acidoferrales bacterium]
MPYDYVVIGAGRQGTAAAYDLARRGDANQVVIADLDTAQAQRAAGRVNDLLGEDLVSAAALDARDPAAVQRALRGVAACVSAVPYQFNLGIARAAIAAGASLTDLGGKTSIVFEELALDEPARAAGVSIVPDCGMVPGLGTSLCLAAMEMVERPRDVFLWDGGLPQHPLPPWNYILTFHFGGLINEYSGTTEFLRDGKLIEVPCFEELEYVDFPAPIGRLEAFTTAGGTSSAPRSFFGRLRTYQNKTLRYSGHCAQWKAFRDAGLFAEKPVRTTGGKQATPVDLLRELVEPQLRPLPGQKDVCILRAKAVGESGGRHVEAVVDVFDYHDDSTGFSAMERTTGWHASILAIAAARAEIARGAVPVERALPGKRVLDECRSRGMRVEQSLRPL